MPVQAYGLGRVPSPPDRRDFRLGWLLEAQPLDVLLAQLEASSAVPEAVKAWARRATAYLRQLPEPPLPPAPPAEGPVYWPSPGPALDQGAWPHCVGFAWAGWVNAQPVEGTYGNWDGHAVYYECKWLEGRPGTEEGAYVRSGAQAMRLRGRLDAYGFAVSLEEVRAWLRAKGPLVLGTWWTEDMLELDGRGFARPTGPRVGGHAFLAVGDDPGREAVRCRNSWGEAWGERGEFWLAWSDLAALLADQGEAAAALELPR
ncbi:MAG: hypothetical protein QN122_12110 [Armatimonadota bacterium]|nr:hypothetical protein [Armatimonadota bacterium]